MEEEKKEELKVEEETKIEKPKRSAKSKVITVMLCISLFCVLSILIFVIFGNDLLPFNQQDDNTQEKKEDKIEDPTKLVIYQYKDNDNQVEFTTNKKDGYKNEYVYYCPSKNCKLLNTSDIRWSNNVSSGKYAVVSDNNKIVLINIEDKRVMKTDIMFTNEYDKDGEEIAGYIFSYNNDKYKDLRIFENDNNKNIKFIKLSYVNRKDKILALVYDLTKDRVVEGRNYEVHDGMEYSFDDKYEVVFSEEKKEEQKQEEPKKEAYHIVDGEKFVVYGREDGIEELQQRDKTISFVYPVIDIDSEDAKAANKKIKEKYDEAYKLNLRSEFSQYDCVAIKKNDKFYGGTHIFSYSYDVTNNDKFISVALTENEYTECAGGYDHFAGYVIDKTTKKAMTNKELINYFGANEAKVISIYNENADTFDYKKANSIDEVELVVKENKLYVVRHGNGDELELAK